MFPCLVVMTSYALFQRIMSENVPADLKYAKSHEWVRIEGGTATVGISDHAQHELTDVVFVELPAPGRKVAAGEACAVVESVKTASDIYSPMSGEVAAINPELAKRPELVNSEPYQGGWFFKLKLTQPGEAEQLLSAADYAKQIAS
jgi:glycine cleavage system H protein